MSIIVVNQVEILELVSRGQRVVTFEMVANVHGATIDSVKNAYSRNSSHFEEGVDTWLIEGEELQELKNLVTNSYSVHTRSIRVFPELGYYLLIKPMRDATAWQVQKEMASVYFAVKHNLIENRHQPAELTPQNQIDTIKSAYEFLLDFGLADDQSKIIVREKIHNIVSMIGSQDTANQIPQHSESSYFLIENLMGNFDVSHKFWFNHRGQIGKVVRAAIQGVDPDCAPYKIKRFVNGSEVEVNGWPREYWDIAVAATQRYIERVSA